MRRRSRATAATGEERPLQRLISAVRAWLEQLKCAALSKGERRSAVLLLLE
jgi:hypothetical protein